MATACLSLFRHDRGLLKGPKETLTLLFSYVEHKGVKEILFEPQLLPHGVARGAERVSGHSLNRPSAALPR